MARIRSIKPEFWTDERVVDLDPLTRLFFIGCWNFADDYGYILDKPRQLQLQVLPAEKCDAQMLVKELVHAGLLDRYPMKDGGFALHIRNWEKHQKVDKRTESRIAADLSDSQPVPPTPPDDSESPADSPRIPTTEGKGVESKGMEGSREERERASALFEDFWKRYPPGKAGNKPEKQKAREAWLKLSDTERAEAMRCVENYRLACEQNLTIAKYAQRWLREKNWTDWAHPPRAQPNGHAPYQNYSDAEYEDNRI